MADRYSAHYISGTHWDREWYRPFQEYRLLLVQIIDQLLDLMETSTDFRYFHLDGQTCVLQDYLDVRPENRDRLQRLISAGRILIGPWFTMPDLFCPGDDEALVRNLLLGRRISREWAVEPMGVAYTCDMFGHPSQMPQIYRRFGLPYCVLGRGNNEDTTPAFFTWEAPDGSRVFTFKLQDQMGYGAFVGSRRVLEKAADPDDPDVEARAKDSLRSYATHEMGRSDVPVLCLMDALDHMPPATDAARYLRLLHEAMPQVDAVHSTLPAFFQEAERRATDLPVMRGERREPSKNPAQYLWLIPNCVSARVETKQANDESIALLEHWAEPWVGLANLAGAGIPERFLRIAWENVLLNHAHDTICGCSVDQVHRDMMYRFDQARVLSRQLRNRAFGFLTQGCADLATAEHEFTVTIANPLPTARREVVTFDIDLPLDYPTQFKEGFRSQNVKSFTLHTADGTEAPYQRLAFLPQKSWRSEYALPAFVGDPDHTRYTVAAEVDLPALGFTSLLVRPSAKPVRRMGSLRTGPNSAANEHLAVTVEANGTLTLTDKATGEVYRDLLTFEDRSEIGDGWFHGETVNDEIALSTGSQAQISVMADGPDLAAFRIETAMCLPERYDWHGEKRSIGRVDLRLVSTVTLRRGARTVEVETVVDNSVEDHRLRLLLPTDVAEARTWLSSQPYDVIERPIALDPQKADWQEPEIAEKPFQHMQAVGAGQRGLAFLSGGGLHEGGVADDARRTMHITLMRSFRRTVGTTGERDGLELGRRTYRYALMPFAGDLPRVAALREAVALQAGLLVRQTGPLPSGYPPMAGSEAASISYLEQERGTLVLSALKPAADGQGLVVRLWNPTEERQSERLRLWRKPASVRLLNLAEEPSDDGRLTRRGDTVTVEAGPKQVVTVGVEF